MIGDESNPILIQKAQYDSAIAWRDGEITFAEFLARSSAHSAGYLWSKLDDTQQGKVRREIKRYIKRDQNR